MDKIFINGYGWTGSSAVTEALRLHSDINFVPNEFDDLRVPFGAYDLYQQKIATINNKEPHSFSALAEFDFKSGKPRSRSKGLIKALPSIIRSIRIVIPYTDSGHINQNYRKYFFKNFFRMWSEGRLFKKFLNKLEHAVNAKEAHNALVDWIDNIAHIYSDKPNISCIFDQGLLIENAEPILKTLPNTKLLLVIRDPIKQIADILSNDVFFLKKMSWRTRFLFGVDNYDLSRVLIQFAEVTAYRLDLFFNLYNKLGKQKILIVDYDAFLSDFENQLDRISNFLGVSIISEKIDIENFDLGKSRTRNNMLSLDLKKYKKIIDIIKPIYNKVKNLSYD